MPPTRTSSERTNHYDARAAGRSELPMANKVVSHTKPRFDINASLSKDEPLVVIFFTTAELAKLDAHNILGNIPCTKYCLDMATWGFGAYIYDQKTGTIEYSVSVCKACYAYEHANPQKDEDEELILLMRTGHCLRAPKCTCPEGSEACQEPFTGCELHQILAIILAPPGVRKMHRPAKRQQLREHVEAIMVHYDDAVTQSEHRLNFHSAMWDRRDRLERLDSLDQLDLEDRKHKWNTYQTALLAVKSTEAAAERANKLADNLSNLAHAAPVDLLREKVARFIKARLDTVRVPEFAKPNLSNHDRHSFYSFASYHHVARRGIVLSSIVGVWTEHRITIEKHRNGRDANTNGENNDNSRVQYAGPDVARDMESFSALAARMAESLMRSTASNLEQRDAHDQEREAFHERVCLARRAADKAVEYIILKDEYNERFGASYWIAQMQTARVSDGLPIPRASSPMPPITMPEPTNAEEEHAQELICEVFNQHVCEAKALADEDRFNEVNARAYQGGAEEYGHAFGLFVPDAEIDEYLILKRKESLLMDVRRELALKEGCPFENPQPLERYIIAAHDFYEKLGQAYKNNADGQEDVLNQKCELLGMYQKLLLCCWNIEEEWKLVVGQETQSFTFVNPFLAGGIQRAALNRTCNWNRTAGALGGVQRPRPRATVAPMKHHDNQDLQSSFRRSWQRQMPPPVLFVRDFVRGSGGLGEASLPGNEGKPTAVAVLVSVIGNMFYACWGALRPMRDESARDGMLQCDRSTTPQQPKLNPQHPNHFHNTLPKLKCITLVEFGVWAIDRQLGCLKCNQQKVVQFSENCSMQGSFLGDLVMNEFYNGIHGGLCLLGYAHQGIQGGLGLLDLRLQGRGIGPLEKILNSGKP
ncbi:hypothetical protein C8R45DRAFT_923416 [Mycena sanguinolenta]|nr:hypothetical protein C8R45DRAFT_923416 [Mycena sanguinolenta]